MKNLAPYPKFRAFDDDGNPLSGGLLYTYEPGTSTNKATYTDQDLAIPQTNPVVLDARGEADVFLDGFYKFVIKDSGGNLIDTQDEVCSPDFYYWTKENAINAFVDATSFTLVGDLTSRYRYNLAIQLTQTASGIGYVTSSSYSGGTGLTTVIVNNLAVDSGLTRVEYGQDILPGPQVLDQNRMNDNAAGLAAGQQSLIAYCVGQIDSVASLLLLNKSTEYEDNTTLWLGGYYSTAIGGEGFVVWDSTSTATHDGFRTFKVTAITTGRWIRPVGTGLWNIKECGAKGLGVDETTIVQPAINTAAKVGLYFPEGTWKGNWTLPNESTIVGANQQYTSFVPAIDDHVFQIAAGAHTVRLILSSFKITGNLAFTNSDGINFDPAGAFFIDSVTINRVNVSGCGGRGLYVRGSGATNFGQDFTISESHFSGNAKEGIFTDGLSLEYVFNNVWCTGNGSKTIPNCSLGDYAGNYGATRLTWTGGGLQKINTHADVRTVADMVTTAASNTATSATAAFTSGDVGKTLVIENGNVGRHPLITTIATYVSATQITTTDVVNVTNAASKAAIDADLSGLVSLRNGKQVTFIGVDFEDAAIYFKIEGTLTQNVTTIGCNFGSTGSCVAAFWLLGACGRGFYAKNNNYSSAAGAAGFMYGLINTGNLGVSLGPGGSMKEIDFETSGPFTCQPYLVYDYQAISANTLKIYQLHTDVVRINGTGSVDTIYDAYGGFSRLISGKTYTFFPAAGCTFNHLGGNIFTKTGSPVVLAANKTIRLMWVLDNQKWIEV